MDEGDGGTHAEGDGGDHPLRHRPRWQHLVLRGDEPKSLLIAARTRVTYKLETLYWHRYNAGVMRSSKKTTITYCRVLIVKILLDMPVAHYGRDLVIMLVHMHNNIANNKCGPEALGRWWNWIGQLIAHFHPKLLAGD